MSVVDEVGLSSGDSDSSDGAEGWEQGGDGYSVEYSLWMLKFLCPKDGCGGTLAPPNTTAIVMEVRLAVQRRLRRLRHARAIC